jgi:adenylate cyclase
VSYAHEDADVVFEELRALRARGWHIWYDEGISAGTSWRAEIADAIERCAVFLIFLTSRSVASEHCTKELNLALDRKKPVIPVYLDATELPSAIALELTSQQGIMAFELDDARYRKRLSESLLDLVLPGESKDAGEASAKRQTIAVMPFSNLSVDLESQYFSDGIAEEILHALIRSNAMPVVASSSSFQFRGDRVDLAEAARRLNAGFLVEGSVRKAGDQVRVTVRLVDGMKQVHLWSDRYDRRFECRGERP